MLMTQKVFIFLIAIVAIGFVAIKGLQNYAHRMKTPSECEKQALQSAERDCVKTPKDTDAYSDCVIQRLNYYYEQCELSR